jgi:hypothetical protein
MALKKNRLMIALLAAGAMAIFAACASAQSPTVTPTPTATPTPTPLQVISIDPQTDPAAFLAALPSAEVNCATSAVGGRDNLIELVSMPEDGAKSISHTQMNLLPSCFSSDTVMRVVIGQLELETGGLSKETSSCVAQYTDGINFASMFSGTAEGPETVISTLQAVFCLSPEERRALESSDQSIIEVTELGGIDALECAVDGAGSDGLAVFGNMFEADGSVDPLAVGKFIPLLIDCGVMDDSSLQTSRLTSEQFSCLFDQLDPETLSGLMNATANPSSTINLTRGVELLAAMTECGLDLQELIDSAGPTGFEPTATGLTVPAISPDVLSCLVEKGVSPAVIADYVVRTADSSNSTLLAALALCESSNGSGSTGGITVPDGDGGMTTIDPSVFEALPITAEQTQCLIAEIGAEQLESIADGSVSPVAAIGALTACEISITDLLGG